jgi:hypothetical protein
MMETMGLIGGLILWAAIVYWWIVDSTKQEEREARERNLIMESYRDHERR